MRFFLKICDLRNNVFGAKHMGRNVMEDYAASV